MGPHLFRYGKYQTEHNQWTEAIRFNGATSFQIWKVRQAREVFPDFSLQWGHIFSDMESKKGTLVRMTRHSLQWGHIFSDMERISAFRERERFPQASMGPHLFRYGKDAGNAGVFAASDASMGPHLFRYGKKWLYRGCFG